MIKIYKEEIGPYCVLRADYTDTVESWQAYQHAILELYALARQQPEHQPVIIVHNPQDVSMPFGNALYYLKWAAKQTPSNVKQVYMIIRNPVSRRLTEIALRLSAESQRTSNYTFCYTVKAAYKQFHPHHAMR